MKAPLWLICRRSRLFVVIRRFHFITGKCLSVGFGGSHRWVTALALHY